MATQPVKKVRWKTKVKTTANPEANKVTDDPFSLGVWSYWRLDESRATNLNKYRISEPRGKARECQ